MASPHWLAECSKLRSGISRTWLYSCSRNCSRAPRSFGSSAIAKSRNAGISRNLVVDFPRCDVRGYPPSRLDLAKGLLNLHSSRVLPRLLQNQLSRRAGPRLRPHVRAALGVHKLRPMNYTRAVGSATLHPPLGGIIFADLHPPDR